MQKINSAKIFVKIAAAQRLWLGLFLLLALSLLNETAFAADFSQLEKGIIEQVNQTRAERGLEQLAENKALNEAAKLKAQDMLGNDYFAHTSPAGKDPWTWLARADYNYRFAGENLAMDFVTAKGVHDAWMKSPTHKENIVSADYQEIGVAVMEGIIDGKKHRVAVQFFGQPTEFAFEDKLWREKIEEDSVIEIRNVSAELWQERGGSEVLLYAQVSGKPDAVEAQVGEKVLPMQELQQGKVLLLVGADQVDWRKAGKIEFAAKQAGQKVASSQIDKQGESQLATNLKQAQANLFMASVRGAKSGPAGGASGLMQSVLLLGLLSFYFLLTYNIKVLEKEKAHTRQIWQSFLESNSSKLK